MTKYKKAQFAIIKPNFGEVGHMKKEILHLN